VDEHDAAALANALGGKLDRRWHRR
jgi:hypothetical protein